MQLQRLEIAGLVPSGSAPSVRVGGHNRPHGPLATALALAVATLCGSLRAQDDPFGVAMPLTTFLPNQQAYEFAVGFRLDRLQLLKVGYEAMAIHGGAVVHNNVFGIQFVTSIDSLSNAFR